MALNNITISKWDASIISITSEAEIQMYAGDRGTTVYARVELNKVELLEHIQNLQSVYDKLEDV